MSTILQLQRVPKASDDMPIALGSASCDYGELHVLRCEYSTDTSACTHERDIVLKCSSASIFDDPYDTQLWIVSGTFSSTGILKIYINKQWGNICYSHFDQGAADSACRQLGYTNAASFNFTKNMSSSRAWLSEVQCKSQSYVCLSLAALIYPMHLFHAQTKITSQFSVLLLHLKQVKWCLETIYATQSFQGDLTTLTKFCLQYFLLCFL